MSHNEAYLHRPATAGTNMTTHMTNTETDSWGMIFFHQPPRRFTDRMVFLAPPRYETRWIDAARREKGLDPSEPSGLRLFCSMPTSGKTCIVALGKTGHRHVSIFSLQDCCYLLFPSTLKIASMGQVWNLCVQSQYPLNLL